MEYKVSELASKAGVTKRTIHYYISKGLLMPPDGNGVNSSYDDSHLERILLIKKLQADYMPLNKIREYILEGNSDLEVCSGEKNTQKNEKNIEITLNDSDAEIYIKEKICDIFDIH